MKSLKTKFLNFLNIFYSKKGSDTAIDWKLYGRVFKDFAKPNLKLVILSIGLTILAGLAEAKSVTLMKDMVDEGFIQKNIDILYVVGLQIVVLFCAKSVLGYLGKLTMGVVGLRAGTNLRRRLFVKTMDLDMGYIQTTTTGRMLAMYSVQGGAVLNLATKVIIDLVKNISTIIMMLCLMVWYAPQMLFLILIVSVFILAPILIIMKKMRKLTQRMFGVYGLSVSHINQSIQGIKTIQAYSREKFEISKMNTIEDTLVKNNVVLIRTSGLQTPILDVLIGVLMCFALIMGGHYITNGNMSMGDFLAFLMATVAAYKPLKDLTNLGGTVQSGMIGAQGIYGFIDGKSNITDKKEAKEISSKTLDIEFKDVKFAYNRNDGDILHGINLYVSSGKVCALVGESGGGKSTIINLIERFYDVTSGSIEINGIDIRDYKLKSLRENISEVSQDVFLFDGTIYDNIRYGKLDATEKEIEQAAKMANAHDFIMETKDGYNTIVGEKGVRLSGGQKQRIAIARAVLKNAPILLLDEATSALDTQSEKLIQKALKDLMKGRTTFVIAHRLSTILDADMICVVKQGKIVEKGTDEELSAQNGEYKTLKAIQFRDDH